MQRTSTDVCIDHTPDDVDSHAEQRSLTIGLINPRFTPSYWSSDYSLKLYPNDVRCQMVTGALPALAGLAGSHHNIELLDENVEQLDFEDMDSFDVIGVTGMIVQSDRMKEILYLLREVRATIVIGGPLVTCSEDDFKELADVRFIGEAEETWPLFLDDLAAGRKTKKRYVQDGRSDMTCIPKPRNDLIKASRYAVATVQFSRGCPYLCEFCDIIVMFGRVPRVKKPAQVIAELDDIHAAGFRLCFIVDDNFIGNKKEAKDLLQEIVAWQKKHGYPLALSTEASMNLADEPEILELMKQANFTRVFLGIETPNAESLKETKKTQNTRGDSLLEKVQRIRNAGLVIVGGFIVGFDHDDETIFDSQYRFIQEAGIGLAMLGILAPIPTTPLYDRLSAEGRLELSDQECPFIPKLMSRERLKQGCHELLMRLYAPEAFFERVLGAYHHSPEFHKSRAEIDSLIITRKKFSSRVFTAIVVARLAMTILREGHFLRLAPAYWRAWRLNAKQNVRSMPFSVFINMCAQHWHFYKVSFQGKTSAIFDAKKD